MLDAATIDSHHALHALVLFLGHPRSGTTLVASLLDAHPDIAIAFQRDAVGLFASGVSRDRIICELIESSAGYLDACASVVFERPWRTRHAFE